MIRISTVQLLLRYGILGLLSANQAYKLAMILGFVKKTYNVSDNTSLLFFVVFTCFVIYLLKRTIEIQRKGLVQFQEDKITILYGFKKKIFIRNETQIQISPNGQKIIFSGQNKVVLPIRAINKKDVEILKELIGDNVESNPSIDNRDLMETVVKDVLKISLYYIVYFAVAATGLVLLFGKIEKGASLPYVLSLALIGIPFIANFVHVAHRADYHRTKFKENGDAASSMVVIVSLIFPVMILDLTVLFIKFLGRVYG